MKIKFDFIKENKGSSLIFALLIMVVLSVMGVYSINDSIVEGTISRNHSIYKKNLYLAELAVKEALQQMENADDENKLTPGATGAFGWVKPSGAQENLTNNDWKDSDNDDFPKASKIKSGARYMVELEGYAYGNDINMVSQGAATTHVYSYRIYGRGSADSNSSFLIEAGYWKRY